MSLIPSFFGNHRSNVFDPFSLDIWDPFEGFPFSGTVANLLASARETTAVANARIYWKEKPEAHVFKVDFPSLKKEEVKKQREIPPPLVFRLPENAKLDQVKAAMENGVLTVTVPKEEAKKPEAKAIDISG
ncbi:hypothetical protein DH2020_022261 [Rehmannia glutinosa]|uniref:SHSP domain-containing protein n=1 Tax=Rehmannia glutinosa TaxID=99300 RepID=A0ABR0WFQ5_REHGL